VFASALIVFREVLEAALIIAIVMGASRGLAGRGRWVAAGIALGLAGATLVAAFAGAVSEAAQGRGQEILNAAILLAAVLMLGWHNVWMSSHGRKLAGDMKRLGHDVRAGVRPLSAMLVVTALAVLREGSETVLFLYSMLASGSGRSAVIAGSVLGVASGALLGVVLYRGLLRVPLRHFFSVTGWIILLLAAGLAANAAGYLSAAGLLPVLYPQLWDSSQLLSQHSLAGEILHILIGYNDAPTGIQALFYLVTLITIGTLMQLVGRHARVEQSRAAVGAESAA
jgi:high-affinity iron transporter